MATGGEELEDSREYDETESQPAVDNVAKQPNKSDPIDTVDMNAKKDNSDEPIRANHYILRKRSDIGIRSN